MTSYSTSVTAKFILTICDRLHSPLSLHFGFLFFLLFLLLLIHSAPLTQRPAEHIDPLGRRRGSLPPRRGRVRFRSGARFPPPVAFGLSGLRALLLVFVPGPRAAALFVVFAAFGVLGSRRAATPRTTHFKRRFGVGGNRELLSMKTSIASERRVLRRLRAIDSSFKQTPIRALKESIQTAWQWGLEDYVLI